VCGASVKLTEHGGPGASSSSKKVEQEQSMNGAEGSMEWQFGFYYGGGPWLSMLTLQVPI